MKSLRRSTRGLSPIFATLILIAIAVIAGIVVYMFASGTIGDLTSGGATAQEKAAVQGVGSITGSGVTAYAQYVSGGNPIGINGAIFNNANGDSIAESFTAVDLPVDGSLTNIPITVTGGLPSGTYTLTLTSAKGGSFTSSSFTVP